MAKLLGISGSLRQHSLNTALLKAGQALLPDGVTLEIATLHGIPLYDGDLEEKSGIPEAVTALKQKILASDGIILASPEYNAGIPGVFKNAIDWVSRPPAESAAIFQRPFAVIGASPSGFGTILGQHAWLGVLRQLGADYWSGGRLLISRAHESFDDQGKLINQRNQDEFAKFLQGFAKFASRPKP